MTPELVMLEGMLSYLFFYGFSHPYYQEIEYRDLMNKAMYPDELKTQCDENLTFTNYDTTGKHQGGDFLLEQKIKQQKLLAPKGFVEKKTWQRISRSIDKIDVIYKNSSEHLHIGGETKTRIILNSAEVLEWRSMIRFSSFLTYTSESNDVFNIHGEPLSEKMRDLKGNLDEEMKTFYKRHLDGECLAKISTGTIYALDDCAEIESDDDDEYDDDDESQSESDEDDEM